MNAQNPSSFNKIILSLLVWVPLLCVGVAIFEVWNRMVNVTDLIVMFIMFILGGYGITIGYHRMLTHKSFHAPNWVRAFFLGIGSMTLQGPAVNWAATHIQHHANSDVDDDPHSPLKSFFHAHVGWILDDFQPDIERYAGPLLKDPLIVFMSKTFLVWVGLGLLVPSLICGWAGSLHGGGAHGFLIGALQGLLWGGFVRIFLNHHVTWSVNSVCHTFGGRDFETTDVSRNNFLFGILALGEGWHNNHHAFPRSAHHGMRWSQPDPSAWLINGMEKVGLARDVVRISPERQAKRRHQGVGTTEQDVLPGVVLGAGTAAAAAAATIAEAVAQVTSSTAASAS